MTEQEPQRRARRPWPLRRPQLDPAGREQSIYYEGTVHRWFEERGFGFLTLPAADGTVQEIFCHVSDCACRRPLIPGQRVKFQLWPNLREYRRPRAMGVQIVS
jgi:cold shock CspA family protein